MQVKYKITTLLVTTLIALTLAFSAAASPIKLTATLDGAQANAGAGTGSLATGTAMMWFDSVTSDFSWDISWSGLSGAATVAHFHGPALPNQNAGVALNIILGTNGAMGSATLNANQASDLLNGLWYINVHTASNPGGEIRGQVMVPAPSIVFLLLISLSALWYRRTLQVK